MRTIMIIFLLLPGLLAAQDFQYRKSGGKFVRSGGRIVKSAPYTAPGDEDENDTTYILYNDWDFEEMTIGEVTEDTITKYFPDGHGTYENFYNNAYIVSDTINGSPTKVFRISHRADDWWHGFAVHLHLAVPTNFRELTCSYNWKFSPNYNSGSNGKLPGFRNIRDMGECPVDDTDGWMSNIQFKRAGATSTYHYDFTDGKGCPWGSDQDSVIMYYGSWYEVKERLVWSNNVQDTGVFEVWIDGNLVLQETGIATHNVDTDTFRINSFYLANFFGGGNSTDSVVTECWGYIDNIKIYADTSDATYFTQNTHSAGVQSNGLNPITDRKLYAQDTITSAATNLTTYNHPSNSVNMINEMWLIDAGHGNTVQVDFQAGDETGGGDYLILLDGNQTDSEPIHIVSGYAALNTHDFGSGTPGRAVSTQRYMWVAYITDWDGGLKFNADITFNTP